MITVVSIVFCLDENAQREILGVFGNALDAVKFVRCAQDSTEYNDLWIEKHPLL